MRTTIDIPDEAFRQLKVLTAQSGITMKDFILRAVNDSVVKSRQQPKARYSVKLPLISSKHTETIPSRTNAEIEDLLD